MGGDQTKHRLSNILYLESSLNGLIESDVGYAEKARRRGIKISRWADPTTVPVTYADGRTYMLDDDGGREVIDERQQRF
ncbi:MAG: hypothetical protein ACK5LO_02465 [Leucobacter sp.]